MKDLDGKEENGNILRGLRNSRKVPGQERIYTAGEKEHDVWLYRKDKGVPITEVVRNKHSNLRKRKSLFA